jgi:hypothetical protein
MREELVQNKQVHAARGVSNSVPKGLDEGRIRGSTDGLWTVPVRILPALLDQAGVKQEESCPKLSMAVAHKRRFDNGTANGQALAAANSGTVASFSYSSSVRCTKPAAMFSSRCSTEPVPGMGSMMGDRRSSQANATCLEVA